MERFADYAADLGWRLTDKQLRQYASYQRLLIEWNQRMNLTAVREPELIQKKHFLDSMSCAKVTGDLSNREVADVGTGAGFPGLPLKILYPHMHLTLIDSISKKARFLQAIIDELGLAKVKVVVERAEVLGQQASHRSRYDWVMARGVARLRVLSEYLLPMCRVGGCMLAMKGKNVTAEIKDAANAISLLGGASAQVHTLQVPELTGERAIVTIKKVAESPARYPRRSGIPAKRPL